MKALVYTKYGGPEVLELKETERPVPKDDEVLVKVHAVSLNDWDWALLLGDSFVIRLMNGFARPKRTILGSDIAGQAEAVGKNVSRFHAGDEVFGDLSGIWGGLAEYVCAKEKMLALKPASMSFIDAAAIPQAAMLAVQGLRDVGQIRNGQTLLINGAGGGVGTFGLQLAKLQGVKVTGVDRPEKLGMMSSLGFDHVIDYTTTDFTNTGQRYDLILDTKTNRSVFDYSRALNRNGAYVTVGGDLTRVFLALVLGPWISWFRKKHIRLVALKPNKDLALMSELYEAGQVKPVIEGPYRLEDAREAFSLFGRGQHKGKVVVSLIERT